MIVMMKMILQQVIMIKLLLLKKLAFFETKLDNFKSKKEEIAQLRRPVKSNK